MPPWSGRSTYDTRVVPRHNTEQAGYQGTGTNTKAPRICAGSNELAHGPPATPDTEQEGLKRTCTFQSLCCTNMKKKGYR